MSAKNITTAARLIDSEALHLSQYGNPRAKLWLELADGSHVIARTATDAAAGYCVDNWRCAKARGLPWVVITYHITRGGSVIVDYIHDSNCFSRRYAATAAELNGKGVR